MVGEITPEALAATQWIRTVSDYVDTAINLEETRAGLDVLRFDTEMLAADMALDEPLGEDVDMADDAEVGESMEQASDYADAAQFEAGIQTVEIAAVQAEEAIAIAQSGALDDAGPEARERFIQAVLGQMQAVEVAVNDIIEVIENAEDRVTELEPLVAAAVDSGLGGSTIEAIYEAYGDALETLKIANEEGQQTLELAGDIMEALFEVLEEVA
jgi:hypothetical protein